MRAAIVGCGQIADAHIQEIRRIPGAAVEAVCDLNSHMAEQAGARFAVPGVFTDIAAMLRDVKPDVVHITTPPASHLAIGRAVVAAGAHAYIEKPFTVTAAEAEELVACAERAGKLLCVGHSFAFDESMLRLREAHRAGELGDVVHVDTVMGYNLSGPFGAQMMGDPGHWIHRLPGGIPQNNISHPLSMLLPFLPDERPRVSAFGMRWRPERYGDVRDRFFDEMRVHLEGKSATASILFTSRARPVQLCAIVHGTKAQAVASIDGRNLRFQRGATMPGPFGRVQWNAREYKETRREFFRKLSELRRARLHFFQGMHELIRRFYLAIEGKDEMPVAMAEASRTTRILEEIFRVCEDRSEGAS
jgi:predicted dehydrogenase